MIDQVNSGTRKLERRHLSAVVGHLIVIALRTGRALRWDPTREAFVGQAAREATAHLARRMRQPYDYRFAR